MPRKIKDIGVGAVFKRWEVINGKPSHDKHGKIIWLCRCLGCGRKKYVLGTQLRNGRTGGCIRCSQADVAASRRIEIAPKMRKGKWIIASVTDDTCVAVCALCGNRRSFTRAQIVKAFVNKQCGKCRMYLIEGISLFELADDKVTVPMLRRRLRAERIKPGQDIPKRILSVDWRGPGRKRG